MTSGKWFEGWAVALAMEIDAITDAVVSHALSLGLFDRVNFHEPKSSPGTGLTCACWAQSVQGLANGSGLTSTTGKVVFYVRIYTSMLAEPLDAIDPTILRATDALFTAYSGDFTLDGLVQMVDLLGHYGTALTATAGYLTVSGAMQRIMTIELPLIVPDVWSQVP
jgi:hypothetical protein